MKIQPTLSEAQPSATTQSGLETNTDTSAQAGDFFAMLAGLFMPQMSQKPFPESVKVEGKDAPMLDQLSLPTVDNTNAELPFNLMPNWSIPLPQAVQQASEAASAAPNEKPLIQAAQTQLKPLLPPTKAPIKDSLPESIDVPTYTDFDVPASEDETQTFADAMLDAPSLVLPSVDLTTKADVKIPDHVSNALTDISQVLNQAVPSMPIATPANHLTLNTKEVELNPLTTNPPVQIEFSPVNLTAVGKEVYNAQIKIHPPELGNIIAKLKMDKGGANLTILAENNVVKGIVEANLPALREHFQRADIPLNQIQVQVEVKPNPNLFTDQQREQRPQNQSNQYQNGRDEAENANLVQNETKKSLNSLVDTYA